MIRVIIKKDKEVVAEGSFTTKGPARAYATRRLLELTTNAEVISTDVKSGSMYLKTETGKVIATVIFEIK